MSDLPETIGKYKIVSEIARGGMGIVYKAIHPSLKRHVIIKKLSIRGNNSIKEQTKSTYSSSSKTVHSPFS